MTAGVAALPEEEVARVLDRVRRFDEWTKDNDPHGEHDFGSFDVGESRETAIVESIWPSFLITGP